MGIEQTDEGRYRVLSRFKAALERPCPELDGPTYLIPDEWVKHFEAFAREEHEARLRREKQ